ncbi:MAG: 5-(carboxyamino)imidazole ribonucleotide synthase [Rhodospirillales bacterium]|nr:5-(carboxyamino)imidazole ribonucleotide synthase [Rhodospirillales bacterium]MDE0381469.1 5-(carboxyamino)imidazole ribonucleotide synthase [Rhodospirillales bacterium]
MIAPGGTIGILGGGQLGRMLALAAAPLGYRCHIFSPEPGGPAAQVAAAETVAAYDDHAALDALGARVDVVTVEFENVPAQTLERLARQVQVQPGARSLRVAQNRVVEKDFVRGLGLETTPYAALEDDESARAADRQIGRPAILKTQTLGYDGKGQVALAAGGDLRDAWLGALGGRPAILEALAPIEREISVVVARAADGQVASFDPVENRHVNGILDVTLAPADASPALAEAARDGARRIVHALEHVGVLCVELFVTAEGRLLVNEIAPRVHNSGHWTIEGCETSQFAQHVRAVCGMPLGSTGRRANAAMKNLLGTDAEHWRTLAADAAAHLHLYGKAETRPGRKMGHVTWLGPLDAPPPAPDWPPSAMKR